MRCRLAHILLLVLLAASCDAGFDGLPGENRPPDTALSVRDENLLDNLGDEGRLRSTIRLSWTGDDPDGFVAGFDVRVHPFGEEPSADAGWTYTTANDSLLLLPLAGGESTANVVVEVRAVDELGLRDPSPARSVFPIRNSPPEIRLSPFELPPDTTFTVISFAWTARDPDGEQNLASIGISLNDSTSFVEIPPEFDFVTLVADQDQVPFGGEVEARIFLGRGVQATAIRVPGLRLDAENTFYVRARDQADTTSTVERHAWWVKANRSDVLFVNDYRLASNGTVLAYHSAALTDHLPAGYGFDLWDITRPYTTGSSGTVPRSDALPPVAEPMLRMTLSLYRYIYWVSTSTTGDPGTDNMPFVAPAMPEFFASGGKLLVHSPVTVSSVESDFSDNAAVLLLPLSRPLILPDSIGRLELRPNALVTPTTTAQAMGLPQLASLRFFINVRPYEALGAAVEPLYSGAFIYRTTTGASGTWTEPTTVASISADRRIALFSLPLVNDLTLEPQFRLAEGTEEAGPMIIHALLDALSFPAR